MTMGLFGFLNIGNLPSGWELEWNNWQVNYMVCDFGLTYLPDVLPKYMVCFTKTGIIIYYLECPVFWFWNLTYFYQMHSEQSRSMMNHCSWGIRPVFIDEPASFDGSGLLRHAEIDHPWGLGACETRSWPEQPCQPIGRRKEWKMDMSESKTETRLPENPQYGSFSKQDTMNLVVLNISVSW